MLKQYKLCTKYSDFVSYQLFEDGKNVSGGGCLTNEKDKAIAGIKQCLERKGYKKINNIKGGK
jgi:hypothetical protein